MTIDHIAILAPILMLLAFLPIAWIQYRSLNSQAKEERDKEPVHLDADKITIVGTGYSAAHASMHLSEPLLLLDNAPNGRIRSIRKVWLGGASYSKALRIIKTGNFARSMRVQRPVAEPEVRAAKSRTTHKH